MERFRERGKYVEGGRLQATLQLADVGRVDATPERQALLGETGAGAGVP